MSWLTGKIMGMPRIDRDDALTRVELARVEGAVSSLNQTLSSFQSAVTTRMDDQERRIRINEAWRLAMPASVISSVVALVVALFHH